MVKQLEFGTLNGQPIGFELPDPVSCEVCGHPVYLGQALAGVDKDERILEVGNKVMEQTFAPPGSPWALSEHRCRERILRDG